MNEVDDRQTVAMCDVCGRGYMWVAHPDRETQCLAKDGGLIRMLVTPENHIDDSPTDRQSRLHKMRDGGYVVFAPVGADR